MWRRVITQRIVKFICKFRRKKVRMKAVNCNGWASFVNDRLGNGWEPEHIRVIVVERVVNEHGELRAELDCDGALDVSWRILPSRTVVLPVLMVLRHHLEQTKILILGSNLDRRCFANAWMDNGQYLSRLLCPSESIFAIVLKNVTLVVMLVLRDGFLIRVVSQLCLSDWVRIHVSVFSQSSDRISCHWPAVRIVYRNWLTVLYLFVVNQRENCVILFSDCDNSEVSRNVLIVT